MRNCKYKRKRKNQRGGDYGAILPEVKAQPSMEQKLMEVNNSNQARNEIQTEMNKQTGGSKGIVLNVSPAASNEAIETQMGSSATLVQAFEDGKYDTGGGRRRRRRRKSRRRTKRKTRRRTKRRKRRRTKRRTRRRKR